MLFDSRIKPQSRILFLNGEGAGKYPKRKRKQMRGRERGEKDKVNESKK